MTLSILACLGVVAFILGLIPITLGGARAEQWIPVELTSLQSALTIAISGCFLAAYAAVAAGVLARMTAPKAPRKLIRERVARHVTAFIAFALLSIGGSLLLLSLYGERSHTWPPPALSLLVNVLLSTLLASLCLIVVGPGIVIRLLAATPFLLPLIAMPIFWPADSPQKDGDSLGLVIWCVAFPIFVATASYPLVVLAAVLALRRTAGFRGGLCSECGCDLAGNASGVCPECGSRVRGQEHLHAKPTLADRASPP